VRMIPDNDRPSRSRATTTTTSPARGVIQERGQPWPVVAGPGQLVGEDPLAASCCQCVALLVQRLVVGAHPGIADGRHLRSVSKVGLLAAVATPGFGPTSRQPTTSHSRSKWRRPGPLLDNVQSAQLRESCTTTLPASTPPTEFSLGEPVTDSCPTRLSSQACLPVTH